MATEAFDDGFLNYLTDLAERSCITAHRQLGPALPVRTVIELQRERAVLLKWAEPEELKLVFAEVAKSLASER